mmetsp:Transcript_17154/g.42815  ORF Transcript_17154/g.42815 Transcript_17154/m.42815 type:complete len:467 (+) Transcript_17154:263-1663(+)
MICSRCKVAPSDALFGWFPYDSPTNSKSEPLRSMKRDRFHFSYSIAIRSRSSKQTKKVKARTNRTTMGIFKKIWGYITRRSEVQDQILSTLDQIQRDRRLILDRLDQIQGIPAQKKAVALTISLLETFEEGCELEFGHGVLLRCREEQGEKRFAILTAAHVAIVAFKSFQYGHFQKVCFSSGIEYMIDKDKTPELFFPHEYLCQGTHDFGVLVISIKGESPDKFENLALSIDDPFVTEHFGRASDVQFKSTPTMVNELRVRLQTGSKPDCRGTPLFSPRGELLSVLHGVSKHRGGHTRLHSGDGDKLSTYVYVDMVKDLGELPYWEDECAKCLHHLESLTEEEEKNPHLKLKKPIDGNGNNVIDDLNTYKLPSTGALEFYREVKKLRDNAESPPCFRINGLRYIFEIMSKLKAKFFPVVNNSPDYFTLAEICDEIISQAQAKSNITLADRLSLSESGNYQGCLFSE